MKIIGATKERLPVPAPPGPGEEVIWLFDSSQQILVYRDPSGKAYGFRENEIAAQGWNMDGIRTTLPRAKLELGGGR